MDKPKKSHASDEEATPGPAMLHPSAPSPFVPLSRRRRQQQLPQPAPAVARPNTNPVLDASPVTISAALARAGRSASEPVRLAWSSRSGSPGPGADGEIAVEPPPPPDAA